MRGRHGGRMRWSGVLLLASVAAAGPQAPTREEAAKAAAPPPTKPAPPAGPSFDELSRRAAAAREASQVQEAIRLYRQALRLRPKWDEGLWYLATLQYEADQFAEARESFRRFLARKPEVGAGWALRGLCDFRLGDFGSSLEHLQKGVTLGSLAPEILRLARYHQALLLVKAGQFELAVFPLTLLARAEPESLGLVEPIGLLLLRKPRFPSELPEAERPVVRMAGRAGYLHLARKGAEAERAFADLVAAYPKEPWVHYAQGVFLMASDSERGLAALRREVELQPGAVYPHLEIAFELLRRGDHEGARAAGERAVELAPGLFAARNAHGRALVELGELERGIAELEEAVRLAPTTPEMYFSLARAYQKAGRRDDADRARATFTELDRQRRAERGEPAAEGSGGEAPPR